MTVFDRAWSVVKAPIDMDEANELAERLVGYYGSFASQLGEEPDEWAKRLAPIIQNQTNEPTNTASPMPFTGQKVFRAGAEPDIGHFFSPQRMTADQYSGWDNRRYEGNILPTHSYRLPEIDPSRILRIPTVKRGYGLSGTAIDDPDVLQRLKNAGVSPKEWNHIYMGGIGEDDVGGFKEKMQDADYDYAVWPEMASSALYPPTPASIAQGMGIPDDLRAKIMRHFGSEGLEESKPRKYPRNYQFPTQWAYMHTGGDKSRPIHETSYEPMDVKEWFDRFGLGGWR